MEDLDIIPPEEVKSVSVQLVTYNGHHKSAFGSISVDFSFEDGTCVAKPGVRCLFSGVTLDMGFVRCLLLSGYLSYVLVVKMVHTSTRHVARLTMQTVKLGKSCFEKLLSLPR